MCARRPGGLPPLGSRAPLPLWLPEQALPSPFVGLRLLRAREVASLLGVSETVTLHRYAKDPSFAQPLAVGVRATRWVFHEVEALARRGGPGVLDDSGTRPVGAHRSRDLPLLCRPARPSALPAPVCSPRRAAISAGRRTLSAKSPSAPGGLGPGCAWVRIARLHARLRLFRRARYPVILPPQVGVKRGPLGMVSKYTVLISICYVHKPSLRWRGEHPRWQGTPVHLVGSSPRGRGTQCSGPSVLMRCRFIPAWGGCARHPRGTPHEVGEEAQAVRFIPAWAGNTGKEPGGLSGATVHPRVGGEHRIPRQNNLCAYGSSPRGRGTPRRCCFRAGPGARSSVHPRVGGEHIVKARVTASTTGSSPRGRGTQKHHRRGRWLQRFIPAWAGNTGQTGRRSSRSTVHPRVGGEHPSHNRLIQRAFCNDKERTRLNVTGFRDRRDDQASGIAS